MNFSLLISLYYKENHDFLDLCFKSCWSEQTIKPTEVVLVLDGPIGENLLKIVHKWKNIIGGILKIIQLTENMGLGKALNEGLRYCTNEWVFRMDTDDICVPNRFEKQIDYICKNKDVVLFGGQILEFNNVPFDINVFKLVPTSFNKILRFSNLRSPLNHVTVAFKKSVILKVGGYQHHPFMEDYNLWLRVISADYKLGNIDDVLVYVRVGNGMYDKRKGFHYIKSEKQLLNLKKDLNIQNHFYANILFFIRATCRLMPSSLLSKFYNLFLRKRS